MSSIVKIQMVFYLLPQQQEKKEHRFAGNHGHSILPMLDQPKDLSKDLFQ
jgi:hypothetical protein